ncbi:MAG: hypothetical protein ACFFEN_02355 [Candidatus Thorarchaeota archaeon]
MSKFERYKKKTEPYIYPHKHCDKCGAMIKEAFRYCPECYEKSQVKKISRIQRFFKRKKQEEKPIV